MWHNFDKEKPIKSGHYVTISDNGAITNLPWSQKHQCFNAHDDDVNLCFAIRGILHWAYFDDVYPMDTRLDATLLWHERALRQR